MVNSTIPARQFSHEDIFRETLLQILERRGAKGLDLAALGSAFIAAEEKFPVQLHNFGHLGAYSFALAKLTGLYNPQLVTKTRDGWQINTQRETYIPPKGLSEITNYIFEKYAESTPRTKGQAPNTGRDSLA